MKSRLKSWRSDRRRDRRGPEIEHLVPEMIDFCVSLR